jgi:uncharacterized phage protein (TIGR02216 family)
MSADPAGRFAAGAVLLAGLMARRCGWRPAEFWAATPAEIAAVLGPPDATGRPFDRATLDELMARLNQQESDDERHD